MTTLHTRFTLILATCLAATVGCAPPDDSAPADNETSDPMSLDDDTPPSGTATGGAATGTGGSGTGTGGSGTATGGSGTGTGTGGSGTATGGSGTGTGTGSTEPEAWLVGPVDLVPEPGFTSYEDYDARYGGPVYSRQGDRVTLGGMIRTADGGAFDLLGTLAVLPVDARPPERLVFSVNQHDMAARIDVLPDGQVLFVNGDGRDFEWVSLGGIVFDRLPSDLSAEDGYASYEDVDAQFSGPTYAVEDGVVTLGGMVRPADDDPDGFEALSAMLVLPLDARPPERLVFAVNQHGQTARVDVLPSGEVIYMNGAPEHPWLSLAGISYDRYPEDLPTEAGYRSFELEDDRWSGPVGARNGNLVTLGGMIQLDGPDVFSAATPMLVLPEDLRPVERLVFPVNQHDADARVDVRPDGHVYYLIGEGDDGWISLGGIAYQLPE